MLIEPKGPWKHVKTITRIEWENRLADWWQQIQDSDVLPTANDHIILLSIVFWLVMTLGCWLTLLLLVIWTLGQAK